MKAKTDKGIITVPTGVLLMMWRDREDSTWLHQDGENYLILEIPYHEDIPEHEHVLETSVENGQFIGKCRICGLPCDSWSKSYD